MNHHRRYDVLGLGALAIDEFLYVDAYPPPDRKVRVLGRQRQCGGLAGTALVAAGRLGARCGYAGSLGVDELSQEVDRSLRREGVDVSPAVRRPDSSPAHSTIVVDIVHHTRTIFSSSSGLLGPAPDGPAPEILRSTAVLLIDHHGLEGTLRAARIARDAGVQIVADFERDPGPPLDTLIAMVDHLILSQRFARQWTGVADPGEAARQLWCSERKAVVVTCGDRGCWYVDRADQSAVHYPAFPVPVVDTTGCGDVFHGAYSAALAANHSLVGRVAMATAAAALKATTRGGQAGIPDGPQVQQFLAQRISRI